MPTIKLQSSDDEVFETDLEVAKCFGTIKCMFDSCDAGDEAVPLPKVNSATLRKVLEWATHHKDDPEPKSDEKDDRKPDDLEPWDAEFLNVDQGALFELIMAANYLNIEGLLKTACKSVANMMRGKTAREIRESFNIRNDFSIAEEAAVRKENEWFEEK